MSKISRGNELVAKMLKRNPKERHAMILSAVENGISRQLLKIVEQGMHNGKSDKDLDDIQHCDISSKAGLNRARTLAGMVAC